jgi:hypothetical protein
MLVVDCHGCARDLTRVLARLQALADDLRRYADGQLPTDAELAMAPQVERWVGASGDGTGLVGLVHGQPVCQMVDADLSAAVWVIAPQLGWVRTTSGLYRLAVASGGAP